MPTKSRKKGGRVQGVGGSKPNTLSLPPEKRAHTEQFRLDEIMQLTARHRREGRYVPIAPTGQPMMFSCYLLGDIFEGDVLPGIITITVEW